MVPLNRRQKQSILKRNESSMGWRRFKVCSSFGLPLTCLIFFALSVPQGFSWGEGEALARGPSEKSSAARPEEKRAAEVARRHLREHYRGLGLRAQDLSSLKLEGIQESPGGYHVRFGQTYRGLPVEGGRIAVHLDRAYKVVMVKNRYVPNVRVELKEKVKQAEAIQIARSRPKHPFVLRGKIGSQKVIFLLKDQYRLVWKVSVPASRPMGDWVFFVDATEGKILKVMELSMSKEEEEEKEAPKGSGHPKAPGH